FGQGQLGRADLVAVGGQRGEDDPQQHGEDQHGEAPGDGEERLVGGRLEHRWLGRGAGHRRRGRRGGSRLRSGRRRRSGRLGGRGLFGRGLLGGCFGGRLRGCFGGCGGDCLAAGPGGEDVFVGLSGGGGAGPGGSFGDRLGDAHRLGGCREEIAHSSSFATNTSWVVTGPSVRVRRITETSENAPRAPTRPARVAAPKKRRAVAVAGAHASPTAL